MSTNRTMHSLRPSQVVTLDGRPGLRVTSIEGRLWLTHEAGGEDVVLAPGEAWTAAASAAIFVQGLGGAPSRAAVEAPAAGRWPLLRRWASALIASFEPRAARYY